MARDSVSRYPASRAQNSGTLRARRALTEAQFHHHPHVIDQKTGPEGGAGRAPSREATQSSVATDSGFTGTRPSSHRLSGPNRLSSSHQDLATPAPLHTHTHLCPPGGDEEALRGCSAYAVPISSALFRNQASCPNPGSATCWQVTAPLRAIP